MANTISHSEPDEDPCGTVVFVSCEGDDEARAAEPCENTEPDEA